MFISYLKIISRFFLKNRFFSVINIFGLAIGLTASILILQYVFYELSYDKQLDNAENIYRYKQSRYDKGKLSTVWASGCGSIGIATKNDFPEVEDYVRMYKTGTVLVRYKEKVFKESSIFYATNSFFNLFPYKILKGKRENLLTEPYHMVITKQIADKYFPNEDPIGKTLKINTQTEWIIEAVCETPPGNTHLKFDFLVSWSTWAIIREHEVNDENTWFWDGFLNYVKLHPDADPKKLEAKIPALVEEKWGEQMAQYNTSAVFELQALSDIHLYSNYMGEVEKNGNGKAVYFLLYIAIFLIIIAWINYINLATARSIDRAKEVGLKKVFGSSKNSLVRQFLFESSIMNLIAIILSILLIWVFSPSFTLLTGKVVNFGFLFNNNIWYIAILVYLIGTLMAGLYPALVLSSYKPISVLKGSFKNSKQGVSLRKFLVILQFIISFILISGTLIIFEQISFMKNQEKNFSNDNILVLDGPLAQDSTYTAKYNTFKNDLLLKAGIKSISTSNTIPGRTPGWNAGGVRLEGASESESLQFRIMAVDYDFLETYKLQLRGGRFFSDKFGKDDENILLNEAGMQLMGFNQVDSILNQRIFFWGTVYKVIGIIKDYHHESLKNEYDPMIYRLIPNVKNYYSISYDPSINTNQLINSINEIWAQHFPARPFEYFFADEFYNRQYKDDRQYGIIFGMFSILAIIIACLGLFGLASFSSTQRTKEVGIRKVLGASVPEIVRLFTIAYLKLMLIAIFIGAPICYFLMDKWLQNFAYHISIHWWLMVLPALLLIVISLITISSNAIKSGYANPVDSLKNE